MFLFVTMSPDEALPYVDILRGLKAEDGVISVLGNHDYFPYSHEDEAKRAANLAELVRIEKEVLGWTPSVLLYPECDGLYTEGEQSLYVNIGLGGTLPYRIGAPAEITLITLNRSDCD